jgi:hypothetical protein
MVHDICTRIHILSFIIVPVHHCYYGVRLCLCGTAATGPLSIPPTTHEWIQSSSVEWYWRENRRTRRKPFQRHSVHHKSYVGRPGHKPGPPWWEATGKPPELWHGHPVCHTQTNVPSFVIYPTYRCCKNTSHHQYDLVLEKTNFKCKIYAIWGRKRMGHKRVWLNFDSLKVCTVEMVDS